MSVRIWSTTILRLIHSHHSLCLQQCAQRHGNSVTYNFMVQSYFHSYNILTSVTIAYFYLASFFQVGATHKAANFLVETMPAKTNLCQDGDKMATEHLNSKIQYSPLPQGGQFISHVCPRNVLCASNRHHNRHRTEIMLMSYRRHTNAYPIF